MSTLDVKPVKTRILNPKLLPIAAALLVVLALLFMATPLLRPARGFQRGGNFVRQGNGQSFPQNGFPGQDNGSQRQGVPGQGGRNFPDQGVPGQNDTNSPNRQFVTRGVGLPFFRLLSGITGIIIYFMALLVSLVAAVGMFLTKRWGQVLGIVMAVIYILLALLSFLPLLLLGFARVLNGLNLGLSILHLVLALAVIVLASIPAKKVATPAVAELLPAGTA